MCSHGAFLIIARAWRSRLAAHSRQHLTLSWTKWPRSWAIAGVLILVVLFWFSLASAAKDRSVRSVLEIRHERVMIQNWDLSCGAAALGTLLRYQFGEPVTEKQIARGLMSRAEYVKHPELLQAREGFSLLDLKRFVDSYRANRVMAKLPRAKTPIRTQLASLEPARSQDAPHRAKRSSSAATRILSVYKGEGLGQLELTDLIERAPLMVPVDALGYNHFVVFRGVMGNRVLVADPAWGNRTMTIDKFQRMWLDYGESMGHVGFVVARADGRKLPNRLQPKPSDFVMLQ
jgi:uncharacterized protein